MKDSSGASSKKRDKEDAPGRAFGLGQPRDADPELRHSIYQSITHLEYTKS